MSDPDFMEHPINLLELIDGAPFPLGKIELVMFAEMQGASEEALELIRSMPDIVYDSVKKFNDHMGEMEDLPARGNLWNSNPDEPPPYGDDEPAPDSLPDGTDYIYFNN